MNKKFISIVISALICSTCFAFDRDYTQIQKTQSRASGEKFLFRDVFGTEFKTVINPAVPKMQYDKKCFIHEGDNVYYRGDKKFISKMGVDISRHDGKINWNKLKKSGIDFVILRVAYRGYQSGTLTLDQNFRTNIKGAVKAGLDVGLYVFSQAENEAEALEEAEIALREIAPYKIQLPIFYDPEIIRDDDARSDHITGAQFTDNAIAFCEKIKNAGYTAGVYSNMLWQAFEFDLTKLSGYVMWYADYEDVPQTPYHFSFWQYAEKGGTRNAPFDMDVMLVPVKD